MISDQRERAQRSAYQTYLHRKHLREECNDIDTATLPPIVGLYSPVPQSGKSTLAGFLTSLGYKRMGHAEPLKAMADTLLSDYVTKDQAFVAASRGSAKDLPIEALGCTRRDIERALGCGFRDMVSENFWIGVLHARIKNHAGPVVIDDVRFPNEHKAIKDAGGVVWRITRPDSPSWHMSAYESESLLEHHEFDAQLLNDGDIEHLYAEARFHIQGTL